MNKAIKYAVLFTVIGSITAATIMYFQYTAKHPSTDDAYVKGHIVNIAAQVSGKINKLNIKNHQLVKKGQLLFSIDPTPFIIQLNKSRANLQSTQESIEALKNQVAANMELINQRKAELHNTQKSTQRILNLTRQHVFTESQKDNAISQLKVAKSTLAAAKAQYKASLSNLGKEGKYNARLQAAEAAVQSSKLNLSYTKVYAPTTGYINNLSLRIGDTITAYQPSFALIGNAHWWVAANFKETQLQQIKLNQHASITLDMYPNHTYTGKVLSISSGSGQAFALLPAENATGNWVKVTQRFPVWVSIKDNKKFPLRIGASATVTINTEQPST